MEDQSTVLFAGWWRCHGHLGSDRRKPFGCEWKQYKCITISYNSSSWSANCSSPCPLCFFCLIQVLPFVKQGFILTNDTAGSELQVDCSTEGHQVLCFAQLHSGKPTFNCDGFIQRIKSNFMMNLCLFYRCHQLLVLLCPGLNIFFCILAY